MATVKVRLYEVMKRQPEKMSAPKLAELAGVDPPRIYAMMRSPDRVHLKTLGAVCKALNVTPCDLLVLVDDDAES